MMIFFYCSVSLADVTQELVYKVSQNGIDIGKRTIQITYLPTSKASPWGGKKIDFHTEIQPNIAGSVIQYQQRGVAQFSPDRSSFVVSNQIQTFDAILIVWPACIGQVVFTTKRILF